jgi:hypothetical protein
LLAAAAISLAHTLPAGPVSAGPAALPDLTVSIVDSADPVAANEKYSYTSTVSNIGGSTAGTEIDPQYNQPVGVNVIIVLPVGFVTNAFTPSGGGTCQLAPPSPFETLTCHYAPFAPGQVETIIVSGAITPGGLPQVASTAFVDLPINRTHELIETSNNVASQSTNVLQPTSTPTSTATVTPTYTPTHTATVTPTATPTRTRVPPELGGVADYPNTSPGPGSGLLAGVAGAVAMLMLLAGLSWRRTRADG